MTDKPTRRTYRAFDKGGIIFINSYLSECQRPEDAGGKTVADLLGLSSVTHVPPNEILVAYYRNPYAGYNSGKASVFSGGDNFKAYVGDNLTFHWKHVATFEDEDQAVNFARVQAASYQHVLVTSAVDEALTREINPNDVKVLIR